MRMPAVGWRGISKMLGDVWDSGGVKMDVKTCIWNGGFFWKINIDLKWVEKCTQIPSSVVGVQ